MEKIIKNVDEIIEPMNITSTISYGGGILITGTIKIRIGGLISYIQLQLFNNSDKVLIKWNRFHNLIKLSVKINISEIEKDFYGEAIKLRTQLGDNFIEQQKDKYKKLWIHQDIILPPGVSITKTTFDEFYETNRIQLTINYRDKKNIVEYVNRYYQFNNDNTYRYNKNRELIKLINKIIKVVDEDYRLKEDIKNREQEVKDLIEKRLSFFNEDFRDTPYVYNITYLLGVTHNLVFNINYLKLNIRFSYNPTNNTYTLCNVHGLSISKMKSILNIIFEL